MSEHPEGSEVTDADPAAPGAPAEPTDPAEASPPPGFHPIKRMYNWVLSWAESPHATIALFILAFAESSFFPIPPDVLLIALCLGAPRRAFWFAGVCTAGSVLGGAFGYLLGWLAREPIVDPFVELMGWQEPFATAVETYEKHGPLAIAVAAFTPIPYKVFTLAAGVSRINFPGFMLMSVLFRGARFFLVGTLIWRFGPVVKDFIDRWFNLLTIVFMILGIGGFVVVKYALGSS